MGGVAWATAMPPQPAPPRRRARRQYTLAEKLAIVRESQQPGASQAAVSRRHGLGKNVLWTWRKSLQGFPLTVAVPDDGAGAELAALRRRIAELERLLGQKSFEIEALRSRLGLGVRAAA